MKQFALERFFSVLLLALLPAVALAAANATVEAVQSPAWIERAGARIPITPGMPRDPRDEKAW